MQPAILSPMIPSPVPKLLMLSSSAPWVDRNGALVWFVLNRVISVTKNDLIEGLLRIRKEMDTFANLRPCGFASERLLEFSPLRPEVAKGTDFMVIRELCGGVYFGSRKEDDGSGYAEDVMSYTRAEIERVVRLAATLCMEQDPPLPLTSLDKANVIATSRLWRNVVTELMAKEFPKVKVTHHLIDSAAMLMVKNPRA